MTSAEKHSGLCTPWTKSVDLAILRDEVVELVLVRSRIWNFIGSVERTPYAEIIYGRNRWGRLRLIFGHEILGLTGFIRSTSGRDIQWVTTLWGLSEILDLTRIMWVSGAYIRLPAGNGSGRPDLADMRE
jgi:hypothetical protein